MDRRSHPGGSRMIQSYSTASSQLCPSAVGFTRWTHRQSKRFAWASTSGRTNETQDKTKMKPRESCIVQLLRLHAIKLPLCSSVLPRTVQC